MTDANISHSPDFRQIPLTKGYVAIVDTEDYERLARHKWYALVTTRSVYAVRSGPRVNGKQPTIRMHREILGTPPGMEGEHRDNDGLNNRKSNLRDATHGQNQCNARPQVGRSSQYKGVHWEKRAGKWRARIEMNGKNRGLGYFDDELVAAHAYNKAALELHGEFARLNIL